LTSKALMGLLNEWVAMPEHRVCLVWRDRFFVGPL
jgi:hypothetical protein